MTSRQTLVENLLWYMHEHPCCADRDLYEDLAQEAMKAGWVLPQDEGRR